MTAPRGTLVSFTHGDAEWHKLRERCLTDLYWFAGVVLGYGDRLHMHPRVHGLYCRFLERRLGIPEIDTAPIQLSLQPRDIGKSTLGAQALVLQRVLANPNTSILIANEIFDRATKFLGAIKTEMETNQFLRELWPDVIPDPQRTTWATDRIIVQRTKGRKEATIYCIGAGGALAGDHPDGVVVDDIISREAMENARSGVADVTGRVNRWISQLRPVLSAWAEPFPWILFNGTRWYAGDPYEYVEDAFGYGENVRQFRISYKIPNEPDQTLTITRRGDVAMFKRAAIEDGKSIWPENPKFTLEALAKFRLTDAALFACNMMNEPTDDLTATFKESWLRWFECLDAQTVKLIEPPNQTRVYSLGDMDIQMLVDPGGFKQGRGSDRARPAIIITATTPDADKHALLETWSQNVTYQQAIEQVCALLSRYPVRKVWVEVAGQQIVFHDELKKAVAARALNVVVDQVKTENANKDNRILGLEPHFQRGEIFLRKGPESQEFQDQYRRYSPETPLKRRDLLDCLAYGPRVWRKRRGATMLDPVRRQAWERAEYYRRRGLSVPLSGRG